MKRETSKTIDKKLKLVLDTLKKQQISFENWLDKIVNAWNEENLPSQPNLASLIITINDRFKEIGTLHSDIEDAVISYQNVEMTANEACAQLDDVLKHATLQNYIWFRQSEVYLRPNLNLKGKRISWQRFRMRLQRSNTSARCH